MTAVEFAKLLPGAHRRADGEWWDARCPGHDDHRASLSFRDGDRGLILECHAGCTTEKIVAALGRAVKDLFYRNGTEPAQIRAPYDYQDEGGTLLYQVVRFEPKDFRQRRPDNLGGWIWNLEGVRRVLYRLPELIAEIKAKPTGQRRVYVPEGEKDTDVLWSLGLISTTNSGGAGKWQPEYTEQLVAAGAEELVVLPDNDEPGEAHGQDVARSCLEQKLAVKIVSLPGLRPKGDVSDWLDAGHTKDELLALAVEAPVFTPAASTANWEDGAGPELQHEGFDLSLIWPNGVRFAMTAIRDGRDGVRGELTVTLAARRLSWGGLALSSTQAREALKKKLKAAVPELPWDDYLEEAAFRLTQAARQGEPLVTLTGTGASASRELMPRFLYEAEPTLVFGDGDTGKSLVALALAVAVQSGSALPFGLKPARAVPVAYLDWETNRATCEERLWLLTEGLGIDPPGIVYKRMTRPLVDEAAALAAEFARRGIGLVVIDSMMFAVAGGEGGAFHEPITAFYNALRLFAPAASLVLSHITGADARIGTPARPFGGAFAFNGPRLIWEARRDQDVDDATAIVFTCRKANNLARKPEPFGLRFQPGDGTITIYPFDIREATPQATASVPLKTRLKIALRQGPRTVEALAENVGPSEDSVRRTLNRGKGAFVAVPNTKPQQWALRSNR